MAEETADAGDPAETDRDPSTPDSHDDLSWTPERSERLQQTRIFDVSRQWSRAPDGAVEDFYVLAMPDWVQIVPLLPDGRFLMVEQFRQGTRRVTLEFPAGLVESEETPLECAVRELEEETGYVARSGAIIGRVDPNAALQDNELFIAVLRDCAPTGRVDQDSGERIRARLVDPDEVDGFIERGEFRDAYGIIAWDFYRRHLA